jgi:hypothetical protein
MAGVQIPPVQRGEGQESGQAHCRVNSDDGVDVVGIIKERDGAAALSPAYHWPRLQGRVRPTVMSSDMTFIIRSGPQFLKLADTLGLTAWLLDGLYHTPAEINERIAPLRLDLSVTEIESTEDSMPVHVVREWRLSGFASDEEAAYFKLRWL